MVIDTTELCRVAARRLAPEDAGAHLEGEAALGRLVLAAADAFARD